MKSNIPQPSSNGEFNDESLNKLFQPRSKAAMSHSLRNGAVAQQTNGRPKAESAETPAIRAKQIELVMTPVCLASIAVSKRWSLNDWFEYCQQVLADLGTPSDPLERMLIEQFILAQQSLNRMHVAAAKPESPEQADCLFSAIPRLLAELHRLALAIKEYRAPSPTKIVNMVQQQNLAESQQVAYVAGASDAPAGADVQAGQKKVLDTEMVSKPQQALTHEVFPQFSARVRNESRPGGRTGKNAASCQWRLGGACATQPT